MNKIWSIAWVAAACVAAIASRAHAASDGFDFPPVEFTANWAAVAMALFFLAVVCAPAFKNAKRTHLD